jgi:hypothetical protein
MKEVSLSFQFVVYQNIDKGRVKGVQPDCKVYRLHLSHNPLITILAFSILKFSGSLIV